MEEAISCMAYPVLARLQGPKLSKFAFINVAAEVETQKNSK
jgi:hypothetical protein